MKNFFLLVLAILAFVTIDHEIIEKPRNQLYQFISNQFDSFEANKKNQIAYQTRELVQKKIELTEKQHRYISKTFTTDNQIKNFNSQYCVKKQLNIYFQGNKLRLLCQVIKPQADKLSKY